MTDPITAEHNTDRLVTAAGSYAGRHAEALALIDSLRNVIEHMPEPKSDGINWGHVRSMRHINEHLWRAYQCLTLSSFT